MKRKHPKNCITAVRNVPDRQNVENLNNNSSDEELPDIIFPVPMQKAKEVVDLTETANDESDTPNEDRDNEDLVIDLTNGKEFTSDNLY